MTAERREPLRDFSAEAYKVLRQYVLSRGYGVVNRSDVFDNEFGTWRINSVGGQCTIFATFHEVESDGVTFIVDEVPWQEDQP